MSTHAAIAPSNGPTITALRTWALHLTAFVLPLINFSFLVTGPHVWWKALLFTQAITVLVIVDGNSPPDRRQPPAHLPSWPFHLQLWALSLLQIVNHVLVVLLASKLAFSSWPVAGESIANLFAVTILSGVTAGYSGIVLAHELVHRRNPVEYFLGRLLLMGVCYEQFATEHVRGHHPRLGTMEDPATARFGETMKEFFRRTVPGQFRSAWHLEKVRLGDAKMSNLDPRMIGHRVLQGVVMEVAFAVTIGVLLGRVAVIAFLLQAYTAALLLETVNYIEHWGIQRRTKRVMPVDSWDTENAWTLRTLVGLSRHADHHFQAARPYQELRHFDDSPKMPYGYYGTIVLALFANERYQEAAKAELQRRGIGPYAAPVVSSVPPSSVGVAPRAEPAASTVSG